METRGVMQLVDTVPGAPTKIRNITGMADAVYYSLVWVDCLCFDMDAAGVCLKEKHGFSCPVHKQGETNMIDHCWCQYGGVQKCQVHEHLPITQEERSLLYLWNRVYDKENKDNRL